MGEVILSADKLAHLELPGDFCLVFDILAKFMSKLGYLRKQASSTASSASSIDMMLFLHLAFRHFLKKCILSNANHNRFAVKGSHPP